MQGVLSRVLALWVRATLRPEDAAGWLDARSVPVCYVLEQGSRIDLAVLQLECVRERLPRPGRRLRGTAAAKPAQFVSVDAQVGFWRTRLDRRRPSCCCC